MSTFPNPDTYLNHLSPSESVQFETARNLCLAVLGATIWDILIYVPDDIRILRLGSTHVVTACFILSRLFAVTFILLAVIMHTHQVKNCGAMVIGIGIVCVLTTTCASFLFLQRLRAVYARHKWIQGAFTLLWLASSGFMSTTSFGVKSERIPGTEFCVYSGVNRYIAVAGFGVFFFDTLVFAAISYKIASSHSTLDVGVSWDTVVSGRALPRLSRAVLQGGQQYYLITICLSLPVGILIILPSTPPIYKLVLGFPLISLTASMACRVFRNMKLHDLRIENQAATFSDVQFATTLNASDTWRQPSRQSRGAHCASASPSPAVEDV
ncbi:hypothetical protein P691DRAFT_760851 [Macrolepiota fuliginosa MF-IS2]|uniref:Uncharacterized protein n=1 Tax=Macrolepiota fuliginosa MF-IS2 TaxID=1400762 RepID=A0A9P5XD48_9AGAR|nr:hypothetical protein P691DRAFT_760851 [Macrolepiota fuliginosa MF-IS2]